MCKEKWVGGGNGMGVGGGKKETTLTHVITNLIVNNNWRREKFYKNPLESRWNVVVFVVVVEIKFIEKQNKKKAKKAKTKFRNKNGVLLIVTNHDFHGGVVRLPTRLTRRRCC